MFIKLTNTSPDRLGEPVILNTDLIVSIYEDSVDGSLATRVHTLNGLTFHVEE